MTDQAYSFDLPPHHKSIIKVIGVGGGGSNAVNHMYSQGIRDVEFVVCNTDAQALQTSPVPHKLQIGLNLTEGLGAGANPEKGRAAAIESREEIRDLLSDDTKMVFITAGMGGGTGTGAAPVIAEIAQELDLLVVGIVTAPFQIEGRKKIRQAQEGIDELQKNCDTVLVILNEQLRKMYGNLKMREAFAEADGVLTTAAKSIAEIITVPGYINVDFEDVKAVMKNAGAAVMGSAECSGDDRALKAAKEALNSPLLDSKSVAGAKKILFSISSGEDSEISMDEFTQISDYIQDATGVEVEEVIFGDVLEPELGDKVRVTIIATGFDKKTDENDTSKVDANPTTDGKTVFDLERSNPGTARGKATQSSIFDEGFDNPSASRNIEFKIDQSVNKPLRRKPSDELDEESETSQRLEFVPASASGDDSEQEIEHFFQNEDEEYDDVQKVNSSATFDFDKDDIRSTDSEKESQSQVNINAPLVNKKRTLIDEARRRKETLKGKKTDELYDINFYKERWDEPAYLRKKVKLQKTPHSSEKNISRFNLNDENQILGNNKYLHDNVD